MSTQLMERRQVSTEVQLRARADGGQVIEGYSPVYGRMSEDLGGFVEVIERGAASRRITADDIFGLFNHNPSAVLGRSNPHAKRGVNTMRLAEDDNGVHYEIDVPDTQLGRDVVTSIERGDITGASFAFTVLEDRLEATDSGYPLRRIISLRQMFDTGPVTFPAYPDADAGLRRRSLMLAQHADELGARSLDELIGLDAAQLGELIRKPASDSNDLDTRATGLEVSAAHLTEVRLRLAELQA